LKRKIFIVCDDLNSGGAERQALLLATNLKKNFEPILLSFSDGPMGLLYNNEKIPLEIIRRRTRLDFITPTLLGTIFAKKYKPVLLHSWGWMASYVCEFISVVMHIPHVSSVVRMGVVPTSAKYLQKHACKLGSVSVANSRAGAKAWGIPEEIARIVYNGFDWARIPETDLSLPENEFRVLMTASVSELKDWQAFISTAELVTSSKGGADAVFYGYGEGSKRSYFLERAKNL